MTKNWNDENEILKNEMMKKLIDDKMKWWRKWNNEMTKNEMMKIKRQKIEKNEKMKNWKKWNDVIMKWWKNKMIKN